MSVIRDGLQRLHIISQRLWLRLTLAFTLAVLIGILTTALVSAVLTSQEASQNLDSQLDEESLFAFYNATGGIINTLEMLYDDEASTEQLGAVMDGFQAAHPPSEDFNVTFSLLTPAGNEIYSTHPDELVGWSRLAHDEVYPVTNGNDIYGYLRVVIADQIGNLDVIQYYSVEALFTETIEQLWWVILASGLLAGVLSGTIMGRGLAAPLSRLSSAAQAIGARDLSRRVEASGSTEAVQLAHAFNQMAADLENAENLRSQLVADVAHELRTPLTVLQGNLRAMLDEVYTMSKSEVASLYDQTRVLSRLVNDLHELSQAEARQLPLDLRMVDLNEMVHRISGTFETVAEGDGVALHTDLPDTTVFVHGDVTRLAQVLNNLLNNALTHSQRAGRITITLTATLHNTAEMHVHDTGKGIPPDHLAHIFDRFYRVDRTRSRNTGGAGLGLAICKAIVEAHDGKITVESAGVAGLGTTFIVTLPRYAGTPQTQSMKQPEATR